MRRSAELACLFVAACHCGSDSATTVGASLRDAGSSPDNEGAAEGALPSLTGDSAAPSDGGGCAPDLSGILRDFKGVNEPGGHPDFESVPASRQGLDTGIVTATLGADLKPVFAGPTKSTTSQANFDQWFRDVPNVNKTKVTTLPFVIGQNGSVTYDTSAFFPLDGDPEGFGNTPGRAHDYHFTYELHTEFVYRGGEVFRFRGDDDVWVFINRRRAVDLGGVHAAIEATVDIDAEANALGIVKGNTYALDFFFAERHTTQSNFRLETTLRFSNCVPILPR